MDPKLTNPLADAERLERVEQASQEKQQRLRQERVLRDQARFEQRLNRSLGVAAQAQQQATLAQQERTAQLDRTGGQLLGDAGLGMVDFVGGVGTGAVGLLNQAVGNSEGAHTAFQWGEDLSDWTRGNRSEISQLNEQIVQRENEEAQARSQAQYEQDIADGRNRLGSEIRREGRNIGSSFTNTVTNPTRFFDLTTSQIPSLLAGGAAQVTSRAAAATAARAGAPLTAAAQRSMLARHLAVNVGAMEGAGAFGDTYGEVMNLSDEEFLARFPDRAEHFARDPDGARRAAAGRAGLVAAPIQGALAGATSRIALDFETNPIGSTVAGRAAAATARNPSLRRVQGNVRNVGSEVAEEGIQGFTGTAASNIGQMAAGAEDIRLLDDTGAAIGEGMAGAVGMAGGLQAPSAALNTVRAGGRAVINSFHERADANAERLNQQNRAERAVEAEAFVNEATAVSKAAVDVPAEVRVDPIPETPEDVEAAPESLRDPIASPELQEEIATQSADRIQALAQQITALETGIDGDDLDTSNGRAYYVTKTARTLREHLQNVVRPAAEQATDDSARAKITEYGNQIEKLVNSEMVRGIENQLANADPAEIQSVLDMLPEVLPEDSVELTPEVARAVEQVKELAFHAPEKVTQSVARRILNQPSRMTPSERRQMTFAEQLSGVYEQYKQTSEEVASRYGRKSTEEVSLEIAQTGFEVTEGKRLKSLEDHYRDVMQAHQDGDMAAAAEALTDLRRFAEYLQTRARAYDRVAVNQIKENKTDQVAHMSYRATNADGQLTDYRSSPERGWVMISKPGTQMMIDNMFADAEVVLGTYNALAQAFPEALTEDAPASLDPVNTPSFHDLLGTSPNATVAPERPTDRPRNAPQGDSGRSGSQEQGANQETATPDSKESGATTPQAKASQGTPQGQTPSEQSIRRFSDAALKKQLEAAKSYHAEKNTKGSANRLRMVEDEIARRSEAGTRLPQSMREWTDKQLEEQLAKAKKAKGNPARLTKLKMEQNRRAGRTPWLKLTDKFKDIQPFGDQSDLTNRNMFLDGFKLTPRPNTLLASLVGGVRTIRAAVNSGRVSELHRESDRYIKWNESETAALGEMVNSMVPEIQSALQGNLEKVMKAKNPGGVPLDMLVDRPERRGPKGELRSNNLWRMHNRYALNAATWGKDDQGNNFVRYDPAVSEAVAMAASLWAIEYSGIPPRYNEEFVSKMYENGLVPDNIKQALEEGIEYKQPLNQLARMIQDQLGVQPNNDAPTNYSEGVSKALAQEALRALTDMGIVKDVVTRTGLEVPTKGKPILTRDGVPVETTLTTLVFNRDEAPNNWNSRTGKRSIVPIANQIHRAKLLRLMTPDYQDLPTLGYNSFKVPKTKSGTNIQLAPEEAKAVEKANNNAYFLNTPLLGFLEKLGTWNVLDLRGRRELDPESANKNYAKSVAGENLGHDLAQQGIDELTRMVDEFSAWTKIKREEVKIHFNHAMDSNSRIRQTGSWNPQNNKAIRELVGSKGVLNMENAVDKNNYYRALAQALGWKTEQASLAQYSGEVDALLQSEQLQELFADINLLLDEEGTNTELANSITDQIKDLRNGVAVGKKTYRIPNTDRALHALFSWVQYQRARAEGTHTAFENTLAFELDGKTDGPFNAMIHMGLHAMNGTIVKQLAQGGLFINDTITTLNQGGVGLGDLYKNAAGRLTQWFRGKGQDPMTRSVANLMQLAKLADIESDRYRTITAERNIAKGGVMTKSYGSGNTAVINKLGSEIINSIYSQITDALQNDDVLPTEMIENIEQAFDMSRKDLRDPTKYKDFTFNTYEKETFIWNLTDNGGMQLTEAIDADMAPVQETFRNLYTITAIQTAAFKKAYEQGYEELRQKRIDEGKITKWDALSRNDEAALMKEFAHLAPTFPTQFTEATDGSQGITALESNQSGEMELDGVTSQVVPMGGGHIRANINVRSFSYPGVRIAALYNIALGDSAMVIKAYNEGSANTLWVYDGWEIQPSEIPDRAKQINRIVTENFQFDALGAVHQSFEKFLASEPDITDKLSNTELRELAEALHIDLFDGISNDLIKKEIRAAQADALSGIGVKAQLASTNKKTIFNTMTTFMDHMSGGEVPHRTIGSVRRAFSNYDETASRIIAEGAKAQKKNRLAKSAYGAYVREDGVARMNREQINDVIRANPFDDVISSRIFKQIQHLLPENLEVYAGSQEQIRAKVAEQFGEDTANAVNPSARGFVIDNVVYLRNNSKETLLHELIHVATDHLIGRYFNEVKGLTAAQKDALRNLESMTVEFSRMHFEDGTAPAIAQSQIAALWAQGDYQSAVSEFLAWSMTNPEVRAELQAREPQNPLSRLAKRVLAVVRKILGLPKNANVDNFLVRATADFHRLVRRPALEPIYNYENVTRPLFQLGGTRLEQLAERMEKLLNNIPKDGQHVAKRHAAVLIAEERANLTTAEFVNAGFNFTEDQELAFRNIQAVLTAGIQLNPAAMNQLAAIHELINDQLGPEDFKDYPDDHSVPANSVGLAKYTAFRSGGVDQLANMVALAQVDPRFQERLSKLKIPQKLKRPDAKNVDDWLRNMASNVFDALVDTASGVKPNMAVDTAIGVLVERLANNQEKAYQAEQRKPRAIDRLDKAASQKLADLDPHVESMQKRLDDMPGTLAKITNGVLTGVRGVLSEQGAHVTGETIVSLLNTGDQNFKFFRDLGRELVGTTKSQWPIHRLLNMSKEAVASIRQTIREEVPKEVESKFKNGLTPDQKRIMYSVVGKGDMQALHGNMSAADLIGVLTHKGRMRAAQARLEKRIQEFEHGDRYIAAAKDLASHMIHGTNEGRERQLYSNADAIAKLLGSDVFVSDEVAADVMPYIDRLTSLYAIEHTGTEQMRVVADLLKNEKEAMHGLLNLNRALVMGEVSKPGASAAKYNRWKGYIPTSRDPRHSLILAPLGKDVELKQRGYRLVQSYTPDAADPSLKMGYYIADGHAGKATYNQGALQTVDGTVGGVRLLQGTSLDGASSAVITNPRDVRNILKRMAGKKRGDVHKLRAIYNQRGDVVAFERVLDRSMMEKHLRGTDSITNSMGIWLGRQKEEQSARDFNPLIVERTHQLWVEEKHENPDEFTDISKPKTKVERDTWDSIPDETKELLRKKFGEDGIMVRKDLVYNTVGYRTPSVADVFTGMTELSEPIRKAIEGAALAFFGEKAYRMLTIAERDWQDVIGWAKNRIIVASGVVALANELSNNLQLLAAGIPFRDLPKIKAAKVAETEVYLRNQKEKAKLEMQLLSAPSAQVQRAAERKLDRIDAQNRRLSIWPLLEQGEFPSIVEGLSEQDEYTRMGDMGKWLEGKYKSIPEGTSRAIKNITISKDSSVYQGLNRMIQMSDFVAKAMVYDQYVKDGRSQEDALRFISETFVNYQLLPGRGRTYLEGMGATWFMNYKIRMQKIVLRTLRENPVHFLKAASLGKLSGVDSLWDTFGPNAHWEVGMGPGMLETAPTMNAWYKLGDAVF